MPAICAAPSAFCVSRRGLRKILGHDPQNHAQVADDDLQQIIEVVRDAARELADGLHLLRLMQGRARR